MATVKKKIGLFVQEHSLFESLMRTINESEGYCSVGAGQKHDFRQLRKHRLTMVIVDLEPRGFSERLGLIRTIKQADACCAVLVVSTSTTTELVVGAFKAGADGYVVRDDDFRQQLITALDDCFNGGVPMSSVVSRMVVNMFHERRSMRLSHREAEVLRLMAEGLTCREIASSLLIANETTRKHVRNIYEKLDVRNKAAAIAKGKEKHIVQYAAMPSPPHT